eukprot:g70474.t1
MNLSLRVLQRREGLVEVEIFLAQEMDIKTRTPIQGDCPDTRLWGEPWLAQKECELELRSPFSSPGGLWAEEHAGKIKTPVKKNRDVSRKLFATAERSDGQRPWTTYSAVEKHALYEKDWEELTDQERTAVINRRERQDSFSFVDKKTQFLPLFSAHVTGARNLPCKKSYVKIKLYDQSQLVDCVQSDRGESPNPKLELHRKYELHENESPDEMWLRFEVYNGRQKLVASAEKQVEGLDGFRHRKWSGALMLQLVCAPGRRARRFSLDRRQLLQDKVKEALESPMLFCRVEFCSSEYLREKFIFDTTGNTSDGVGEIIE